MYLFFGKSYLDYFNVLFRIAKLVPKEVVVGVTLQQILYLMFRRESLVKNCCVFESYFIENVIFPFCSFFLISLRGIHI